MRGDREDTVIEGMVIEGIVVAIAPDLAEVYADGQTYLCALRGRMRRGPSRESTAEAGGRRPAGRGGPRASATRAVAGSRPGNHQRGGLRTPPAGATDPSPIAPIRIAPGDRVRLTPLAVTAGVNGVVEAILPRRGALTRSAGETGGGQVLLANLDHAILAFAVRAPAPHFGMLDRYLALCEHAGVEATICLNKADLGVPSEVEAAADLYASLGYRVLRTSVVSGEHLAELRDLLRGRVSLLTGPSGVGKSTIANLLIPGAGQRTSAVSEVTGKGRHTTTGVRLLPLPEGGWLADSAGIRELALWNVPPEELPRCFPELRPFIGQCAYVDCEHGPDEEGCALRGALASGAIAPDRFASFERLLDEVREEEAALVY